MTVYVVMVFERHSDADVELFETETGAVARGREIVRQYAHPDYPEDVVEDVGEDLSQPMREAGWLFYGSWSGEGDRVIVSAREIQGGAP